MAGRRNDNHEVCLLGYNPADGGQKGGLRRVARNLAAKSNDADAAVTEAEQPNGYIPGDIIELSFEFGHNMHVEQVAAIFTKADEPESDIILSGVPETLYEIRGGPNNVDFRSTVTLYAGIEANDPPGLYGCREVFVLTSGGQRLAFETAPDMGFWVVSEPDTPPRYTGEVRPGPSGAGA